MYGNVPHHRALGGERRTDRGGVARCVAGDPRLLRLGEPEVEELHPARGQHDVAGLQIAVDDARGVCGSQRVGDLLGDRKQLRNRQWAALQSIGERFAVEELHHQVVDGPVATDIVERTDMGMAEL